MAQDTFITNTFPLQHFVFFTKRKSKVSNRMVQACLKLLNEDRNNLRYPSLFQSKVSEVIGFPLDILRGDLDPCLPKADSKNEGTVSVGFTDHHRLSWTARARTMCVAFSIACQWPTVIGRITKSTSGHRQTVTSRKISFLFRNIARLMSNKRKCSDVIHISIWVKN